MACKFCPKIKKYDFFWIFFVCIAMWGMNQYQSNKIQQKEQKKVEKFHKLQKECLFGDEKACNLLHQSK